MMRQLVYDVHIDLGISLLLRKRKIGTTTVAIL